MNQLQELFTLAAKKLKLMENESYSLKNILMPITLAALMLFYACAKQAEAEASQEAKAVASGPFFEGPNSLIAEKQVDLAQLLEGVSLTNEQLNSVELLAVNVELRAIDSLDFSIFSDASLSIVSPDQEMISIATLNPIETDGQKIELSASQEADLAEYFKGENYSLILDLGLKEDVYLDEMGAKINLKLNIKYKQ